MRKLVLLMLMGLLLAGTGYEARAQELLTDSITLPVEENRYDYFFLEAMVQRQKGNHDAAFDLLRYCIQIDSTKPEAYYFLSQYYTAMKDYEKALDNLHAAAAYEPDNTLFQETLAQAYLNNKDFGKATQTLKAIADRDKNREDILEKLLMLYIQQDSHAEAIDVLNRLEQLNGRSERLSYTKVGIYQEMGETDKAIAEVKALADQYPNDLSYRAEYASQLIGGGQQKKGLDILNEILAEEPDNARALIALFDYHYSENHTATADSVFERLLLDRSLTQEQRNTLMRQEIQRSEEAGGDSTRVLQLFGKLLALPQPDADVAILCATYMELKKMPKDTISVMLERILELQPDNAAARLQLVGYAWDQGDRNRVIGLCSAARQYNPDEMAFYYYQGMAYYQNGDKDLALNSFQNGIGVIDEQSNPAIVSDFYAIMGDLLHERGMVQQAYEAYDSCLQWKPDNIGCLNNYAYYLSVQGEKLDKAEQMSYKTIKAEPQNPTYLDTYAWILFKQQRYAEARIYIDQALQNDNDTSAVIIEHAGDIYAMDGQTEHAMELWLKARQLSEEDNAILNRKIKLKKYIKK